MPKSKVRYQLTYTIPSLIVYKIMAYSNNAITILFNGSEVCIPVLFSSFSNSNSFDDVYIFAAGIPRLL